MSLQDIAAITRIDRESHIEQLKIRLQHIAQNLPPDSPAQTDLEIIWQSAHNITEQMQVMENHLRQAGAIIESAKMMTNDAIKQRDSAIDELSEIISALENLDEENERVSQFMYEASELYFEHVWETIPYEFADKLQWNDDQGIQDAKNLYDALSIDLYSDDPSDYDITAEDLNAWRDWLRDSIRKLFGGAS